jgi:demethylmenaquinone methyltransferase / 2-methoxy-6-polyprenyl-1,4-benzoquinol methylase
MSQPANKFQKEHSFQIFNRIASTYDLLNHLLSFGIDIYWRNKILKNLPNKNNLHCLDLATGTGDMALGLAKCPRVKSVVGLDKSVGMLEVGMEKTKRQNLHKKCELVVGDGTNLAAFEDNSFDVVTLCFGIRNFSDPVKSLKEINRVLTQGGKAYVLEFSLPKNWFVRKFYLFYFRHVLPTVGKIISKDPYAYTYLNETVESFPYGDEFVHWMNEAGLTNNKHLPLTFGIATLYTGFSSHK